MMPAFSSMHRPRFILFGFCNHTHFVFASVASPSARSSRCSSLLTAFTASPKMFGNIKSIKRDLRVGQVLLHRVDVRGPHVHRSDGDRRALRLVKRSEIVRKTFLCPSITAITRELSMFVTTVTYSPALLIRCFVNPNACRRNLFAARESACHSARQDAVDFVSNQLKLATDCRLIGLSQPVDHNALLERREMRTAISPRVHRSASRPAVGIPSAVCRRQEVLCIDSCQDVATCAETCAVASRSPRRPCGIAGNTVRRETQRPLQWSKLRRQW